MLGIVIAKCRYSHNGIENNVGSSRQKLSANAVKCNFTQEENEAKCLDEGPRTHKEEFGNGYVLLRTFRFPDEVLSITHKID